MKQAKTTYQERVNRSESEMVTFCARITLNKLVNKQGIWLWENKCQIDSNMVVVVVLSCVVLTSVVLCNRKSQPATDSTHVLHKENRQLFYHPKCRCHISSVNITKI